MSKLRPTSARSLVALPSRGGFAEDHQVGGRKTLRHVDGRRVTVPMHRGDLPKGTLRAILRAAEIDPHS